MSAFAIRRQRTIETQLTATGPVIASTMEVSERCGRAVNNECQSGNCVDGYCCSTSCSGTCEACNQSGSLGTCTLLPYGADPDNECGDGGVCSGVSK